MKVSKATQERIIKALKSDGLDERRRKELVIDLLNDAHIEYQAQVRRPVSQSEFCRHTGIAQTSYSSWINGLRLPAGDNVHRLADLFGPLIYDIVGEPRRMPGDSQLKRIAENWYAMPGEIRDDIMQTVEQYATNIDTTSENGATENHK